MVTNLKKNRSLRGHVSAGHGRVGKHRKHPGGRGNAGGQHHHRIAFDKYREGYFGKVGMRHYHKTNQKFHTPSLNLNRIWTLAAKSISSIMNSKQQFDVPVIDVTAFGYHKVLGKGNLPKIPFIMKTMNMSKLAEKKIRAIGGAVLITSL